MSALNMFTPAGTCLVAQRPRPRLAGYVHRDRPANGVTNEYHSGTTVLGLRPQIIDGGDEGVSVAGKGGTRQRGAVLISRTVQGSDGESSLDRGLDK